jgi:hypothetical protein
LLFVHLWVQEQLEQLPFFVFGQLFAEKAPSCLPSTRIFGQDSWDLVFSLSLSRPLTNDVGFISLLLWGVPRDTFKC